MTHHWGRTNAAGMWPNRKPVWTLGLLLIAIASGLGVGGYRYQMTWTPLQRVYLSAYLRSALAPTFTARGRYQLLEVADRSNPGGRLALDEDLTPVVEHGEAMFVLSDAGRAAGDHRLAWQEVSYNHAALHRLLAEWIYRGQTFTDLAAPAAWTMLAVFGVGLFIALPKDAARRRTERLGRRLKGPELVSVGTFNRRTPGDGLGVSQHLNPIARVAARVVGHRSVLRLPHALESSHILLMGDTGTGKSVLIRQLLQQIAARGEAAVIYDPAREFLPQFYDEARGDVILNPLDTRCPFWSPGDEVRHDAEALTLATSLFPDRDHANPFFTDAPRRIFAHLLTFHPSAQTLVRWLCDKEELERRMTGTPYAAMIDREAPNQQVGVRASLNMVADALMLLPAEAPRRWSAASWASQRRGWIFLTSTSDTRERLRPLMSLWLDTLVLRLMNPAPPGVGPVWFVLDEVASLQRLPQLHTALTENRKSNNPILLGFQGRSQLEARYGHDAETMIAQPATKIFLRTGEPHAAKWVADAIGDIEIERLAESRSTGGGRPRSYGLERQVEPLVMASEISGLPNLRALLKLGNLVVRMHVRYEPPIHRAPEFLPRPVPATRPADPPPAETVASTEAALRLVPPSRDRGHEPLGMD
jgi:Type IV secretion-system coupling protein DNA-binding domain